MTRLRGALQEYLQIRRGLGYRLQHAGRVLLDFVGYLEAAGAETVTTELALEWATRPKGVDPANWSRRLGIVRGFAEHLQALDPSAEVPPADLLPGRFRRASPYLYSDADIVQLMAAARELAPPLRAATYETLVGLLAVTGMRVGEAIRLDRSDVDFVQGLLRVRHAKFDRSRELPLQTSTLEALRAYGAVRDARSPEPPTPSFFISTTRARLHYNDVHGVFIGLARRAGLVARSERCRPRIHDYADVFVMPTWGLSRTVVTRKRSA
jgi:integrase/recombinase XerD